MTAENSFSDILTAAAKGWCKRKSDEVVLSMALSMRGIDPFEKLPLLSEGSEFRFLWDMAPGLCIAAAGQCQRLDLSGPRRFELAQKFTDSTLGRLSDLTFEAPPEAKPKVLLAFAFFEQVSERQGSHFIPPAVQSVLPRWQLTNKGHLCWLRLNGVATHESEARELAEQLWLMRERLCKASEKPDSSFINTVSGRSDPREWQHTYRRAVTQGIDLVNTGVLEKIVLAVRHSIQLDSPLDPLTMLRRLRQQQVSSCRFLWQNSNIEAFFGASPERLMSLQGRQLISDALAGTAAIHEQDCESLLRSDKDRREHELVVNSITNQLYSQGLNPHRPKEPQLARHGQLLHLHTPITALTKGHMPLHLAEILHPTPAVAGLPRREAMSWLRTLEPFERGSYAAPIGWIDSSGNAEFRVAIRCGNAYGKQLELTAGAGLVRGSIPEKELQEVGLKLAVLADQLDLQPNLHCNSSIRRVIT